MVPGLLTLSTFGGSALSVGSKNVQITGIFCHNDVAI